MDWKHVRFVSSDRLVYARVSSDPKASRAFVETLTNQLFPSRSPSLENSVLSKRKLSVLPANFLTRNTRYSWKMEKQISKKTSRMQRPISIDNLWIFRYLLTGRQLRRSEHSDGSTNCPSLWINDSSSSVKILFLILQIYVLVAVHSPRCKLILTNGLLYKVYESEKWE